MHFATILDVLIIVWIIVNNPKRMRIGEIKESLLAKDIASNNKWIFVIEIRVSREFFYSGYCTLTHTGFHHAWIFIRAKNFEREIIIIWTKPHKNQSTNLRISKTFHYGIKSFIMNFL